MLPPEKAPAFRRREHVKSFAKQLLRKVRPHKRKENSRVNTRYDEFIKMLDCTICGTHPVDPAHIRIGTDGGMGLKPSSVFQLPLCHPHHLEQHSIGERTFYEKYKLDPHDLASRLSMLSPDVELGKAHLATVRLRIQERSFRR